MSVSGALQLQVEVELFHQSLQLFSPAVPAAIATLAERALTAAVASLLSVAACATVAALSSRCAPHVMCRPVSPVLCKPSRAIGRHDYRARRVRVPW